MAKRRNRKGKVGAGILSFAVVLVALAYGFLSGTLSLDSLTGGKSESTQMVSGAVNPDADVSIHFIDVGQADSIYIKAYDTNILIDAGEKESPQTDVGDYLRALGVTKLD